MEASGSGKSPSATLSFRYNANNEKLEELFNPCEDDPPTPQFDPPSATQSENASPKRGDKTPSILDKYFKSMRTDKALEKEKEKDKEKEENVTPEHKPVEKEKEEPRSSSAPKDITCSPMKEYLNRLGKRNTIEVSETKEGVNETWKIFHDFRYKIAQAVEDMKTKSVEETKEKTIPRENSTSDSEENSIVKDDQPSVGDTDNQVSSLDSSIQNLSEVTQPVTAKATEKELSLSMEVKNSDSSDDTHKNLAHPDLVDDYLNDSLMDVESGVEALEDTMDAFGDVTNPPPAFHSDKPIDVTPTQPPPIPTNFGIPPSQTNLKDTIQNKPKVYILNLTMYILTCFLVASYLLFPEWNTWNGFVFGIWFVYLVSNVKDWVYENYLKDKGLRTLHLKRSSAMPPMYTIPSVKEHTPIKKYEGWINHYRYPDYDPYTYHINKTTTAFMKLEGCNLRISYTRTKIAKRALWDEKIDKISFYQHRLYNLSGAKVFLLPEGLVKRRLWSKKYPICVLLSDDEKIQVLEKESTLQDKKPSEMLSDKMKKEQSHENESTETSSPEKKKKFVWRRREKSVHMEGEPGREGLRHRLVRKMHRDGEDVEDDKRTDSVSTCTEPPSDAQGQTSEKTSQIDDVPPAEDDLPTKTSVSKEDVEEELDETEMSKIKEFLEETEQDTGPDGPLYGEWSVHVKDSKDRNSYLFLFGRTGRDKHEWFRRLTQAISEAQSADSSTSDDKPAPSESKDGLDVPAMKTDNDTVSFVKSTNKTSDSVSEGVTITSLSHGMFHDKDNCEKNFWPYLLKIIQNHEKNYKQSMEIGVMCQLEPTPRDKSKHKKRKSRDSKPPSTPCECRTLPAEVAWLNTVVARVMFDVMRDPKLIARVQRRIQMKLNTLKLPSFMSPLIVTELSLAGACPLIERVLPPAWDARGVWLDADLRYEGGAYIALLTQINLMKLKEKNLTLEDQLLSTVDNIVETDMRSSPVSDDYKKRKPAVYDSEMEDSAESSSDDESPPVQPVDSVDNLPVTETQSSIQGEGGSSKKKFLRMVDKIATNKYFQQVTDYKYVKRAMEGLSNTDIKLHLEVHGLEGRLALNLPPPPHDRLWVGFRTNPQLVLKARPAVGARTLRFAHISNWIEQKLSKEFEKILVLPNMEDIIIDVMTPTPVKKV